MIFKTEFIQLFLIFIKSVIAYRALTMPGVKLFRDKYVYGTIELNDEVFEEILGDLKIGTPNLKTIKSYYTVIHNRALYFYINGEYYNFSTTTDGITVSIKQTKIIPESMIRSRYKRTWKNLDKNQTYPPVMSRVNDTEADDDSIEELMVPEKNENEANYDGVDSDQDDNLEEGLTKQRGKSHGWKYNGRNYSRQNKRNTSNKNIKLLNRGKWESKKFKYNIDPSKRNSRQKHNSTIMGKNRKWNNKNYDKDRGIYKNITNLNNREENDIESDFEDDDGSAFNLKIHKINMEDNEFVLKDENSNSCLTFYKNSFIMNGCTKNGNQIFKLENTNYLMRKYLAKTKKDKQVKNNYNKHNNNTQVLVDVESDYSKSESDNKFDFFDSNDESETVAIVEADSEMPRVANKSNTQINMNKRHSPPTRNYNRISDSIKKKSIKTQNLKPVIDDSSDFE